eukprot:182665-Prymnesium_polylepis.2
MIKKKGNGKTVTHVELAKTGRAKCKICEQNIAARDLRFGMEYYVSAWDLEPMQTEPTSGPDADC